MTSSFRSLKFLIYVTCIWLIAFVALVVAINHASSMWYMVSPRPILAVESLLPNSKHGAVMLQVAENTRYRAQVSAAFTTQRGAHTYHFTIMRKQALPSPPSDETVMRDEFVQVPISETSACRAVFLPTFSFSCGSTHYTLEKKKAEAATPFMLDVPDGYYIRAISGGDRMFEQSSFLLLTLQSVHQSPTLFYTLSLQE